MEIERRFNSLAKNNKRKDRLSFGDEGSSEKTEGSGKLSKSKANLPHTTGKLAGYASSGTVRAGSAIAHKKIREEEKDNSAVQAAHQSVQGIESTAKIHKQHRNASRVMQRKNIRRNYSKAIYKQKKLGSTATTSGTNSLKGMNDLASSAKNLLMKVVKSNKGTIVIVVIVGFLLVLMLFGIVSCTAMFQGVGSSIFSTTYASTDEDIHDVESAYLALESALNTQINQMESSHSGYHEYRYFVDEISHNPYALISYFSAKYGTFTYDQVSSELNTLFTNQYTLTTSTQVEIRTKWVTRTGIRTVIDPETGEETLEIYQYQEEVEYEYYILNITLENRGFDVVAVNNLQEDELQIYRYMNLTFGNREDLFDIASLPGNISSGGLDYSIPSEALSDVKFAAMMEEAEKYLGYPYVWGGASPETSFDCSGFVSWVINTSGVGSIGRQTANGLLAHCSVVSTNEAKPGDLIFFQGTYNTTGASHVGIYVGEGMMIHCGDPIQYTSIHNTYWQNHFYCFGRLR